MLDVSSVLRIALWVIWALLATSASSGLQQTKRPEASPTPDTRTTPTPDDRIDRPTSDPYTGSLSIFEDPKRAEKLQIDRVMDLLAIREGSVVADIGAGSGWFTVRAARRVGSNGTVYAVEINEAYLNHIKNRAEKEGLSNIRTIFGKEDDPLLSPGRIDSILLLKTYHEFSKPLSMLRAMRKAMRKDALLGIIDRDGAGDDHGVDGGAVIKEVSRAGFTLVAEHDFVKSDDMDYFLVFRKTDAP
jgi:SAM-dependent methyltransferase